MRGWKYLEQVLLFKTYKLLPLCDVVQCQLVCKSWSTPAQHVLYNVVKLESPAKMIHFLKGQLSDPYAKAAKFIQTLDISQKDENAFIPPELFQLLASRCSNVEYLLANSDSAVFWQNMLSLVNNNENKYWKSMKCIPFSYQHVGSYIQCAKYFKYSLTELTLKDDDNAFKGESMFKQIASDFPRLKTLEIYDNSSLIKEIHHLEYITRYLPNLKNLCLDRGSKTKNIIYASDAQFKVKKNKKMKSLAICVETFDPKLVDYIQKKYPCLKRIKLVIKDTLVNERMPSIRRLIKLCLSASSNYQLKFSIKKPYEPLDIYYKMLPIDEPKHLLVAYTVDMISPLCYTKTYERAVVDLTKNENNNNRYAAVYFAFYEEDADSIRHIGTLLKKIGKHLTSLTMALNDASIHYSLPEKLQNGYFLDDYVFTFCKNLTKLELRAYSLFACNKLYPMKSSSIQELVLQKCRIGNILADLSDRLQNLRNITFIDCDFNSIYQNGVYFFDFRYSNIEHLSILSCCPLQSPVQIYFDLILPTGRLIYYKTDPYSTELDYLIPDIYYKTFDPNLICIRLMCSSIRYLKIAAGSFHVEKYFDENNDAL